jgi:hypothetical protein
MEQKVGLDVLIKLRGNFIIFSTKMVLVFIIYFLYGCKEDIKFNHAQNSKIVSKDTIIEYTDEIDIHLKTLQKLYYHVSHSMNFENGKDSIIDSYFLFKGKKYHTPKKFKNKPFTYDYSKFISVKSEDYLKVFQSDNKYYVLLQSINTSCNGSNCQSYFLHLLIMDNKAIKENYVFFYSPNEVNFEDLNLSFTDSEINLMNKDIIIEKIGNVSD